MDFLDEQQKQTEQTDTDEQNDFGADRSDFEITVSTEEAVSAELLKPDWYIFKVDELTLEMDDNTGKEFTQLTFRCEHPRYQGFPQRMKFFRGERNTKKNVNFLKAIGLQISKEESTGVNLLDTKGCKFKAYVSKGKTDLGIPFNTITEFRPTSYKPSSS